MIFAQISSTTTISGVLFFTISFVVSLSYLLLIVMHLSAIFYAKYRLYRTPKSITSHLYDPLYSKRKTSNNNIITPSNYYYNQQQQQQSRICHRKYDSSPVDFNEKLLSSPITTLPSSTSTSCINKTSSISNITTASTTTQQHNNTTLTPPQSPSLASSKTMKQLLQQRIKPNQIPYNNNHITHITTQMLPGVSIIKPIVGLDNNLEINLSSYFTMNYPNYELIFCVPTFNDESLIIIEQLVQLHPKVDAKILIGLADVGVNPKINNIYKGYQEAKYDLVMISDSGIFMKPDTLYDMVDCLDADVGLVHQVPFMHPSINGTFAHLYQLVFFGCWHAKIYMSSAFFSVNCTTGMSFLFRRHILDEVGLATFGQYLAEDFFISRHFYKKGWRCVISRQPAWQNSASDTVSQFQNRVMRWYQLRARMVPHTVLLEPLSECFLPGLIMGWLSYIWFPRWINPAVFFLCHVLIWFLLDYLLLQAMLPSFNYGRNRIKSCSFSSSSCFNNNNNNINNTSNMINTTSTIPSTITTTTTHTPTQTTTSTTITTASTTSLSLLMSSVSPNSSSSITPAINTQFYRLVHTPINKVEFLAVWLFRECTSPFLQLRALFRRTVVWRNHKFRIHLGGITEAIPNDDNDDENDDKNNNNINKNNTDIDIKIKVNNKDENNNNNNNSSSSSITQLLSSPSLLLKQSTAALTLSDNNNNNNNNTIGLSNNDLNNNNISVT